MTPRIRTRLLWGGAYLKEGWYATRRKIREGGPPDLLIVGAQKAGTTSLFNYLCTTPGFSGSQRKEVRFFSHDRRYRRGTAWYERFFHGGGRGMRFEATPEYLYRPDVPARIHAHYPNVRIVMVLREPVSRAYSAWNMYRRWAERGFMPLAMWQERASNPLYSLFFTGSPPSFEEYVAHEMQLLKSIEPPPEPGILRRGIYADQLSRYLRYFDFNQVLVLGFSELAESPKQTIDRVVAFAKSDAPGRTKGNRHYPLPHNTGHYRARVPDPIAARLRDFYAPHNERLWSLLGRSVHW